MNTPARLGAYAAGLAVIFVAALGAGTALGSGEPSRATPRPAHGHPDPTPGHAHEEAASAASAPPGLQISQDGYTLVPLTTTLTPGKAADVRFTVTGPDGAPVTRYQVKHEKKLHFIVVSRDLGGFWHLHPEEAGDGVWSVRLTLPAAGAYRAYADFAPEGGPGLTLGADLFVPGDYRPRPLPPAERTAEVDGYTVTLAGDLTPGRVSKLEFTVSKDGRPVGDLEPYLGAYGHLVAIRAGDLAYLHVHPEEDTTAAGVTFAATAPSGGDYRLFLDFKHEGTVRTAAFTVHADAAGDAHGTASADTHGTDSDDTHSTDSAGHDG
ncbi:hypothetical protein GCM10010116_44740 [Microbispora rosea subsp. aerata]|nr:hypothetical protein [Microbispora rosea]GGO22201.1 hypothetical protein GCM10010116_44740 [Microbispora rosea subsp. aerata]GIH57495.1 hypothetical protein Mro02_44090 [Microbispora rosea subsp. aerata]GLJ86445.1 hypothetical protein GCM10017588_51820 [Microbispora rosea subsp. aerata]